MNTIIKSLPIALMVFLLSACFESNSSKSLIADNKVVLIINDEKVTSKQFKKVLVEQKKIFRVQNTKELKPEELIWIKNRVLDEIIKNKLLTQELAKKNITIEQKKIDKALDREEAPAQLEAN